MTASVSIHRIPALSPTLRRSVQLERQLDVSTWRSRHVVTVPLDSSAPTALVSGLIAITAARLLPEPIIAVDPSPHRRLTQLVGAQDGGNLSGLANNAPTLRQRHIVDTYIDFTTTTAAPACSNDSSDPPKIDGFASALEALKRRHRGTIIDIAPDVADTLMAPALKSAGVVVAVATTPEPPLWLFSTSNPLSRFFEAGLLSIVHPFNSGTPAAFNRYNVDVPIFPLGIQMNPDGTSNIPTNGPALSMERADSQIINNTMRLAQQLFAPRSKR